MAGLGMLRNKLEMFLRQNQPQGEAAPQGEMPANVPPSAPMADKVKN
jgi:hypothetical protein